MSVCWHVRHIILLTLTRHFIIYLKIKVQKKLFFDGPIIVLWSHWIMFQTPHLHDNFMPFRILPCFKCVALSLEWEKVRVGPRADCWSRIITDTEWLENCYYTIEMPLLSVLCLLLVVRIVITLMRETWCSCTFQSPTCAPIQLNGTGRQRFELMHEIKTFAFNILEII